MKRLICFILLLSTLLSAVLSSAACAFSVPVAPGLVIETLSPLSGQDIPLDAPSAILMEKETGTVIYEKEAHSRLCPASVTKIMTMLLIVEAIEDGTLRTDDIVTVSARAASFGGSCVYLETGEQMSVHDMLKCISVVSANDCAVAMAEFISGSEENFVKQMNRRAGELGLEHSHFSNCTGLFDDGEHFTTAYDVALMSRELIRHELIKEYTTIWMDSIRGGEFELSNTNKLVYWYPGCTGLKTGYTSTAKYCLSATAERNGTEYIAVIMHADSSDSRNDDAEALLDYAFANYRTIPLNDGSALPALPVELGSKSHVTLEYGGEAAAVVPKGGEPEYRLELQSSVSAPVKKGDALGSVTVSIGGKTVAKTPVLAAEDVERLGFFGLFGRLAGSLFGL